MYLRLEGIAGDDIKRSAENMIRIANLIGIQVCSRFNDVELLANPGGSAHNLVENYNHEIRSENQYKFASSR